MFNSMYHVHKRFLPAASPKKGTTTGNNQNRNDETRILDLEEEEEDEEEEQPLLQHQQSSTQPAGVAFLSMLPPPKPLALGMKLDRKSIVVAADNHGFLQAWDRDHPILGKVAADKQHLTALGHVFPKQEMKHLRFHLMIPSIDGKQLITAGQYVNGGDPEQQVIQIWRRSINATNAPTCKRTKTIKVKFPIYSMCLSTDGALLFVGSENGKIYVINDKDHKVKLVMSDVRRAMKSAASPEASITSVGSTDNLNLSIMNKPNGPQTASTGSSGAKVYPATSPNQEQDNRIDGAPVALAEVARKYAVSIKNLTSPTTATAEATQKHPVSEQQEEDGAPIDIEANVSDDENDEDHEGQEWFVGGSLLSGLVTNICMTTDMDNLVASIGNDIIVYQFNQSTRSSMTELHRIQTYVNKAFKSTFIPNQCLSLSYDDKFIFSAGFEEKSVRVWNLTKGNPVRIMKNHTESITSVTTFPDGLRLLTTSEDHTAVIWEISTGDALQALDAHNSAVTCACISDDSQMILTGSSDGDVCLWKITRLPSQAAKEKEQEQEEMIDRFGYRFMAQGIAAAIKRIPSPYCIGLYSQGGRGKTFMITMLKRAFDGNIQENPKTKKLVQWFERKKRQNLRKKVFKSKYLQFKSQEQIEQKLGAKKDLYDINDDDDFIASDDENKQAYYRLQCQKVMKLPLLGLITLLYAICPALELPLATFATIASQSCRMAYYVVWSLYRRGFKRTLGAGRSRANIGYEALSQFDEDDAFAANEEAELFGKPGGGGGGDSSTKSKGSAGGFANMADENGLFEGQSLDYVFVDFNAWEFSDSNYLWAGMIKNLYDTVEKRLESDKNGTQSIFQRSWKVKWRVTKAMMILTKKFGGPGQLAFVFFLTIAVIIMLIVVIACSTEGMIHFWTKAINTGKVIAQLVTSLIATIAGLAPTVTFVYQLGVSSSVSQGDAIFKQAAGKDGSLSIRDSIGFMNKVKNEIQDLFEFISQYKETMKCDLKLILFVDDLDRCLDGKNVKVLEAIQLLMTIPNAPLFVFLACDSRIMVSSIDEKLRTSINLNIAAISGWEYLEKLVNLSFSLPEPGKEILHQFLTYSVNNSLTGVNHVAMQIRLFYSKLQSYVTLQEKTAGQLMRSDFNNNKEKERENGNASLVAKGVNGEEVEANIEWFVVFPMHWAKHDKPNNTGNNGGVNLLDYGGQTTTVSTSGEGHLSLPAGSHNKNATLTTATSGQTNAATQSTSAIHAPNMKAEVLERVLKSPCLIYDETYLPEARYQTAIKLIHVMAKQLEILMPTTGYFDTTFSANPEQFEKLRYKVIECLRNVQFKPVLVAKEKEKEKDQKEPEKEQGMTMNGSNLKAGSAGVEQNNNGMLNSIYTNVVGNTSSIIFTGLDELNNAADNAMESIGNNFVHVTQSLSRPVSSYTRFRESPHSHSHSASPALGSQHDLKQITEDAQQHQYPLAIPSMTIASDGKENEIQSESMKLRSIPPQDNPFFVEELEHDPAHGHVHEGAQQPEHEGQNDTVEKEHSLSELQQDNAMVTQAKSEVMRDPSQANALIKSNKNRVIEARKSPLPLPHRKMIPPPSQQTMRTQIWRSSGRLFDPILPRETVRLLEDLTRVSHASPRKLSSILTMLRIVHDVANCKPVDDDKQSLTLLDDLPEWSTFMKKLVKWIYLCELYPFRMSVLVLILMDLDQMLQYIEKEKENMEGSHVVTAETISGASSRKKSEVIYWRNHDTVDQTNGRTITILDEVVISPESNEDTTRESIHAFYFRYVENVVIQLQGRDNLKNISKLDGDLEEFALLLQMPIVSVLDKKRERMNKGKSLSQHANKKKKATVTQRIVDETTGQSKLMPRLDLALEVDDDDSDEEVVATYDDILADDVLGKRPEVVITGSKNSNQSKMRTERLAYLSLMSYAFNLNPAIRYQVATEIASMSTKSSARLSGFELRVDCW